MLYNAYNDYSSFAITGVIFAIAFLITCVLKIWNAFAVVGARKPPASVGG
jgi:hypothetical protein